MKRESPEKVRDMLDALGNESHGVAPVQFVQVRDYTTFNVEYTWKGGTCVFHFFRSPEKAKDHNYWENTFPQKLVEVGCTYFQAKPPRLLFEWVPEMDSICLRAHDYENVLDKNAYVQRFFEKLDAGLDTATST